MGGEIGARRPRSLVVVFPDFFDNMKPGVGSKMRVEWVKGWVEERS